MDRISAIKVINTVSNSEITFVSYNKFRILYPQYGALCSSDLQKVAEDDNVYVLLGNNEIGFWGLPENNTNVISAQDQNGWTLNNNNYYSSRQLLWQFRQFYGSNFQIFNNTLFQNDHLLEIQIETPSNNYFANITGTVVGTWENGSAEFDCGFPFFTRNDENGDPILIEECTEITYANKLPYIATTAEGGFKPNKVYFSADNTLTGNVLTFNAQNVTNFKLTVTGIFTSIFFLHQETGIEFKYLGQINEEIVIDFTNLEVFVDGVDVTDGLNTQIPQPVVGDNTFIFDFVNITTDPVACVSYQEVYFGIF